MMFVRRMTAALAFVAAASSASVVAGPVDRAFERGRLFRIDRAGVPASYVYGTMHSNDPRVTALPEPVIAALAASRSAAFETLLVDRDVTELLAAATYNDGRRLIDHIDAATFTRIRTALGPDAPDIATLDKVKPWALLLMLAESRDRSLASLDGILQAEAKARGLATLALELPEEQVASLDAIPIASQVALLRWALDTQATRNAELESTTRAWLAGDLVGLWRLALEPAGRDRALMPHFRALLQHVVTDRNVLMAHRLHLPLARGRVFVAVGALHLYGPKGLLALIVQQGYRVTRVL
jgi:uncharacterized protein YbaP (TraB family)